jgi:hypothetical protein
MICADLFDKINLGCGKRLLVSADKFNLRYYLCHCAPSFQNVHAAGQRQKQNPGKHWKT